MRVPFDTSGVARGVPLSLGFEELDAFVRHAIIDDDYRILRATHLYMEHVTTLGEEGLAVSLWEEE